MGRFVGEVQARLAREDAVNVGLIGFGRIGRLLVRHFARDVEIHVHDNAFAAPMRRRLLAALRATDRKVWR